MQIVIELNQFSSFVCLSICPSVTMVDCGHTVRPIKIILVWLENQNILVSENVSLVDTGHL